MFALDVGDLVGPQIKVVTGYSFDLLYEMVTQRNDGRKNGPLKWFT